MDRNPGLALGKTASRLDYIEYAMACTDRAVLISDSEGRPCYVNPAFTALFGYTLEDITGRHPWELLAGPMTDERLHQRVRQGGDAGSGFYDDLLLRAKSGDPVWVSAKIDPVYDGDGTFTHLMAMLSDISHAKRLQVFQREILEALSQDVALEELMTQVCRHVETLAPDAVCTILRVDEEQRLRPLAAPSMPDHIAAAIDGIQAGPRVGSCGTAAWRGTPVAVEDIETDPLWTHYKGLILPLGYRACWSYPMKMRDGRVAGTFALYFSEKRRPSAWHQQLIDACLHLCVMAIERHEARAKIRRLAYYDALTGLPNRKLMRQRLEQTLRLDVDRKRRIAFLCLDLDRFKDVNDAFGQPMGDTLLEAVGQRVLARLSSADMVCRLSGDRFAIILDDCDADGAAGRAQDLLADLLSPFPVSGASIPLSSSVGIALYPDDARDVDTLLKYGETALVEAKSTTRGSYNFFSPVMNSFGKDRLVLGPALRTAIAEEALSLVFQPQIDRTGHGLYGVEALARWSHPEFGPVAPDRFVAVAEQIGVIEALGAWAMRAACAQLADWRGKGFAVPAISVNVSPQQFRNPRFSEQVASCLGECGLEAEDLTVEITESLMLDRSEAVLANIDALAAMGVRLSMDDFGTGYSSLSLIANLPVTELKVDRAFIDRLADDASAQAITTAVVSIGQSLNMTVVAEGVETKAQCRYLDALGCHAHQGYLYSKPLPPGDMEGWLTDFARARAERVCKSA